MVAALKNNTVMIGKDLVECVTDIPGSGWHFFMMPGIKRDIKVIGNRTMDEAEKIVRHTLRQEGLTLNGYAAQRF